MTLTVVKQSSDVIKARRVLIVDDDDQICTLLAERLNLENLEVELAANGREALSRLCDKSKISFDVVLTDLNMPQMGGIELIERALENGISIPFVILSGFADKVHTMAALKLGAFAFIEKPFRMETLVETLQEAIAYRQSVQGIEEELDKICQSLTGDAEKIKQIRAAQRAILELKRRRKPGKVGVA